MLFINPKPLGKGTIDKAILRKDNFFKKPYGHCALGEYALYVGNEILEASHYLPFDNIIRVYKRIELPAGMDPKAAFLGGGKYFLVVEYDDNQLKRYEFAREAALDRLLNAVSEQTEVHVGAPYEAASRFLAK